MSESFRPANSKVDLAPAIQYRWSPRAFAEEAELTDEQWAALFEAARWAPSAYNSQPWRFVLSKRGSSSFEAICSTMVDFNQMWAPKAAGIVVVLHKLEDEKGRELTHSLYDTGAAAMSLCIQSVHLGFSSHQMSGINAEEAHKAVGSPKNYKVVSFIAVGRGAAVDSLPEPLQEAEAKPRARNELSEVVRLDSFDGDNL